MAACELWNKVFTKRHLKTLFAEKIQGKASVGLDWITVEHFSQQLDSELDIIIRKCNAGTYRFTHYKEFLISKGVSKKPRCISIPTIRDKLVLCALNEVLTGVYEKEKIVTPMPQVVIAGINKEIQRNSLDIFIKIDIESFYASISHDILLNKLKKRIRKKAFLSLITKAITTVTISPSCSKNGQIRTEGLPEGLPISNTLANLYLSDLDSQYSVRNENTYAYKYWRYVDDILVLVTKSNFLNIEKTLKNDIKDLGLKVGEDKSRSGDICNGFDYLGYYIQGKSLSVRKSNIVKLEQSIESIFRYYKHLNAKNVEYLKWKVNLKITGLIFENCKCGWMFFYSQINDYECLYHLDWFISKLTVRYGVQQVHFKRFVRTYKEITHALHTTSYIPNLDKLTTEEKKRIVADIYGQKVAGKEDKYIDRCFLEIMKRELRDIQKDVQPFS